AAHVPYIGDSAFDHLLMFLIKRNSPVTLSGSRKSVLETLKETVVVTDDSRHGKSEHIYNSAGQGSDIQNLRGAFLAHRIGNGVRQDQPPFRVCIGYFDRFSGIGTYHVPGKKTSVGNPVLAHGDHRDGVHFRMISGKGVNRSRNGGTSRHISFYSQHGTSGFQAVSSCVAGHSLSYQSRHF